MNTEILLQIRKGGLDGGRCPSALQFWKTSAPLYYCDTANREFKLLLEFIAVFYFAVNWEPVSIAEFLSAVRRQIQCSFTLIWRCTNDQERQNCLQSGNEIAAVLQLSLALCTGPTILRSIIVDYVNCHSMLRGTFLQLVLT